MALPDESIQQRTPTAPGSPPEPIALATDEQPARVRVDRYGGRPAIYVTSDRLARIVSGLVAFFMVLGTVRWAIEAWDRFDLDDVIRPLWFRVPQFALALAGIVAAVVEIAYLAYFAVTGLVWRRWRGVTLVFGLLAAAWTAVWWIDRLVLDDLFAS